MLWAVARWVFAASWAECWYGFWEAVLTRIVLNGVGKLGQAVIAAAKDKQDGVVIVAAVDPHAVDDKTRPFYRTLEDVREEFDVIVDASRAEGLDSVLNYALKTDKPVVIAATGHNDAQLTLLQEAAQTIPIFKSANLSFGVSVLRKLTEDAGRMLGPVDAEIIEAHHRMKVDAPSGTAYATLELISQVREVFAQGAPNEFEKIPGSRGGDFQGMRVHSVRLPGYVASQEVIFGGLGQRLVINHDTISRDSFLPGVLLAVRTVKKLKGLVCGLEAIM